MFSKQAPNQGQGNDSKENVKENVTPIFKDMKLSIEVEIKSHPIESKPHDSEVEVYDKFHKVILPFANKLPKNPDKILALDLDETLLNYDWSKNLNVHILINPTKIRQLISYAIEHNIMVVCVTSRVFESQIEELSFLSVRRVLSELGIDNFSFIFFTNAQSKAYVLNHLLDTYYSGADNKKQNICMVDDNDVVLKDCKFAGYLVIKAEKYDFNLTYIGLTQSFLEEGLENSVSLRMTL